MGYESFITRDLRVIKIAENAKKFGDERLQNEAVIKTLINIVKFDLNSDERGKIAEIFKILISTQDSIQLSK
ncbi:acetyltransferase [Campylobacter sp. faydin G-105]|uniref:acetyltransferase n=1 Tax=Campylobacter anatolicus TaxID=2829105 RepID=UPI001B9AD934|nr:acetyltransferase [Campylobacter anatolicus]MBR8461663.1 acetyltransferase [Campylobacter anatolicus]